MSDDADDDANADPGSDRNSGRSSAEERYRKIFEHNNDAVMIVDLRTETFVDVNPAACELLGYSRSELLSLDPEDIHPNDMERVREEFISQIRTEGAGFTDDMTCLTKDGEEIPTEISGAALDPSEGDDPTRMVAMLRDVSDRVAYRRELERKVERLDRFADIVSHDLRTPLSVIKGHVRLARETGDPEHFDAIADAAERMDGLLSSFLTAARGGDVVGERTAVDLANVAREVWEDCDLDPATLEVESSMTVRADRSRMRQLFANLFENAFAHAAPPVIVRVGTLDPADGTGFYVEDNGDGIPADEREAVFEWGYTTETEGTGVGLAVVADIVEAHGWEIDVTDSDAGGVRFEITGV